jgi:hypothetical protein
MTMKCGTRNLKERKRELKMRAMIKKVRAIK